MIEYGEYHIHVLEGIYPHIGLHFGQLADGNIHNIKLKDTGTFLIMTIQ